MKNLHWPLINKFLFMISVFLLTITVALSVDEMGATMTAVPVPKGVTVKIDGDLADWDLSAQEWVAVSPEIADRFSGNIAVMYDDNAVYLAVDSTTGGGPMINFNKPNERPWQGHSIEIRFIASPDAPYPFSAKEPVTEAHPNQKYYPFCKTLRIYKETVSQTPYFVIQHGPPYNGMRDDVNPADVTLSFKENRANDRYVMEARVPWSRLGVTSGKNPFKPGDKMTSFWTILWPQMRAEFLCSSPMGGFGWAWHRMNGWGQIKFSGENNITKRHGNMQEYLIKQDAGKDKGTPFEINLPTAMKTSVSIVDKDGNMVRELIGGEPRTAGKNTVYWDGYDWLGNPMPTGDYKWKAYASPGLKPVFMGAAGTSGTPAWNTADGKGGWGGDHGQPIDVASDETGTYFLWDNNEAAKAFVKVGYDDKNSWRNNAFIEGGFGPYSACATNGKYFYVIWGGTKKTYMSRFNCANGLAEPFSADNPYILVNNCELDKNPVSGNYSFDTETYPRPETIGLAATATEVYATAFSKHKIYVYDAITGEKLRELDCAWPRGICADKNGDIYAISSNPGSYGNCIKRFTHGKGTATNAILLVGPTAPWDIAMDKTGHIFVTDSGLGNQIWVYEKCPQYSVPWAGNFTVRHIGWIGKPGGRASYGTYDKNAMLHPTGITVDAKDRVIVAQNSIPAVFQRFEAKTYAVEKEWFGEISYGPPSWPSAKDPLSVYALYKEGKIIRATLKGDGSNGPITAYWDLTKMGLPAPFNNVGGGYTGMANVIVPHGFEYMFHTSSNSTGTFPIFRVDGDTLTPAAYVRATGYYPGFLNEQFGLELWSDKNHNGKIDETEIIRTTELAGQKLTDGFIAMASFWMNAKCDIFIAHTSNRIFRIPAKSVDRKGAITWDLSKANIIADGVLPRTNRANTSPRGGILGFADDRYGNLFTCFNIGRYSDFKYASKEWSDAMTPGQGHTGNIFVIKIEKFTANGKLQWMAGRKATGTAKPGEMYHTWIFAGIAGNGYPAVASEWTPVSFYTPDGFFVDTLLGDPNRGGEPDEYNIGGGENFTGRVTWFADRGECYLYSGNCHPNVYRIDGFDKNGNIKGETRFEGTMKLTRYANPFPQVADVVKPPVNIIRLNNPILSKKWGDKSVIMTGNNGEELAKIYVGYDNLNLYARFEVNDNTPMDNKADDVKLAFKWGDAVGISLGKTGKNEKPQIGNIRLLATEFKGKPVVIAMIPESTTMKLPTPYFTPAGGTWNFAYVGILDAASVRFTKQPNNSYIAEMQVPLSVLEGLSFKSGDKLSFEAEVLLSGYGLRGFQTMSRNHLFTPRSFVPAKMVDDVPTEARLYPAQWGEAIIE